MSDTTEETHSTPKTTRYETTLQIIKGRVIKLNFDLVSGDSSFDSSEDSVDELKDRSSTDPVKLNIDKCFMLRKCSDHSTAVTSGTSELINKEATANDLSKMNSNVRRGSMSNDTFSSPETSKANIGEKSLLNATRVLPKNARSLSAKEKTLICNVCKRGFIHKLSYEKHLQTHKEDNCKNLFRCDLCGKGFLKKTSVTRHFKTVHKSMILTCGECPKYFRSSSGLSDHKKTCHAPRDELLTCPTCARVFSIKKSLVHHLRKFPNHDS